jgi:hypothetical protein
VVIRGIDQHPDRPCPLDPVGHFEILINHPRLAVPFPAVEADLDLLLKRGEIRGEDFVEVDNLTVAIVDDFDL